MRSRGEAAAAHRGDRLLERQVLSHLSLEASLAHALAGQHLLVARHGEAAVVLKCRQVGDGVLQLPVGYGEMLILRKVREQATVDQALEDLFAHCRGVQRLEIDLAAKRSPHPVLLLAQLVLEFGPRDRLPRDLGHGLLSALAQGRFDTEESKGQDDEAQNALDDDSVISERLQTWRISIESEVETKANLSSPFVLFSGGVDGTRTRDPGVTGRYSNQLNYHPMDFGGC